MVKVITLGFGNYVINHGHFETRPALFLEHVDKPGEVGADASGSCLARDKVADGAAVITFGNLAGAIALRDELDAAIKLFKPVKGD